MSPPRPEMRFCEMSRPFAAFSSPSALIDRLWFVSIHVVMFALLMAFFRATYLDVWGVVLCVAAMSVSGLFYIIAGQYVAAKLWALVPISGYSGGIDSFRFLILPVLIGTIVQSPGLPWIGGLRVCPGSSPAPA